MFYKIILNLISAVIYYGRIYELIFTFLTQLVCGLVLFLTLSVISFLLQVAHHYPTIHHLTQTHPHAWLPKRVGTHFALCSLPVLYLWIVL